MSTTYLPKLEPLEHRDQGKTHETCVVDRLPPLVEGDYFQIDLQVYKTTLVQRVMDCQSEHEQPGQYRIRMRRV